MCPKRIAVLRLLQLTRVYSAFGTRMSCSKALYTEFGARASGYSWSRMAGLMVRTFHRLLHVRHALFQYVDDLLVLLEAATSPIWIGILTSLVRSWAYPMSWRKTVWGPFRVMDRLQNINVRRWVVSITSDKREKILSQIDSLLKVLVVT